VRRYAPDAAEAITECAERLEASLQADLDCFLTLQQAVAESGWSYEGLRRALEQRPDLNAGKPGAPLIRRSDLPLLGAPRGSRGPYGARAPKKASLTSSASREGHSGAHEPPVRTVPTLAAAVDAGQSGNVEGGESFATANDSHTEAACDHSPEPDQASPRPTKSRKARQKDAPGRKKAAPWRRSHDAHFDQLLARAARP
jgi:hypothetical protein